MSENIKETLGQFEIVEGEILPTIEFDCSDWPTDIPAKEWTNGQFIPVESEILPMMEIDCSSWCPEVRANQTKYGFTVIEGKILEPLLHDRLGEGMSPVDGLALSCHVVPSTDSLGNGVALLKLMDAVNRFDRTLGGAGLHLQSSSRDNGSLTLVLAPVDPHGAAERVRQIVEAINHSTKIQKPDEVEWIHAAPA